MSPPKLREQVLEIVRREGFPLVRICAADALEGACAAALAAAAEGRLADMAWMTPEWLERSARPDSFLAGARSVILVALPARTADPERGDATSRGRIARYARGRDYHRLFEPRLRRIVRRLRDDLGANARATVDYGPLLERPLAARAGLGWLGKSTMLLVPGFGPWVLLGAITTDLDLEPDVPLRKTCGSCSRCIVACPTGAISPEGNVLDARLCISYHTIENRGPIPRDLRERFGDWVFGCDDCLDSCPVGSGTATSHSDLEPDSVDDAFPSLTAILALDEPAFAERFRGRAIMRARRDGLVRNACVALGNVGTLDDLPALRTALHDTSPLVRGHAAWAMGRLTERLDAGRSAAAAALSTLLATEHDPFVIDECIAALSLLGDSTSASG